MTNNINFIKLGGTNDGNEEAFCAVSGGLLVSLFAPLCSSALDELTLDIRPPY